MKFYIYLFVFFLFLSNLYGKPNESFTPNNPFVGDLIEYNIEFQEKLPDTITYPEGEFIEEGEELARFNVLEVIKENNSLKLKIRFYASGEFILPIEWEEGQSLNHSELKIKISSVLTGNEEDIEPIENPILFSGKYWHRLLLAILIFVSLCYLIYSLFLIWKRQNKIVNANWEKIPEPEIRTKKLYQIEEFLKQEQINLKEFTYLFSSYIKEEYSHRLSQNLSNLTDSAFLAHLYDHSGLEESILREMRIVFRKIKYTNHSEFVSISSAKELFESWKQNLKL